MKNKRKHLKKGITIFLIIWLMLFITDYYRATQNKAPIYAIKYSSYWDGGTQEYLGLGYKVIKYNRMGIYDKDCIQEFREKYGHNVKMSDYDDYGCLKGERKETVIGTWFLKFESGDFINNSTNTSIPESDLSQNINEYLVKGKTNSLESTGNIVGENAVKELVEEFIKTKLDVTFNLTDYVIEINGVDTKYYDFVLYVDGIRTSIGYTAVQDEEGVVKLFDNRNNYDINNVKKIVSSLASKIDDSVRTKSSSQALQKANLEGFDNLNIVKKDGFGYYEVETGKLYYATTLETKTASGAVSTNTYLMEIE